MCGEHSWKVQWIKRDLFGIRALEFSQCSWSQHVPPCVTGGVRPGVRAGVQPVVQRAIAPTPSALVRDPRTCGVLQFLDKDCKLYRQLLDIVGTFWRATFLLDWGQVETPSLQFVMALVTLASALGNAIGQLWNPESILPVIDAKKMFLGAIRSTVYVEFLIIMIIMIMYVCSLCFFSAVLWIRVWEICLTMFDGMPKMMDHIIAQYTSTRNINMCVDIWTWNPP